MNIFPLCFLTLAGLIGYLLGGVTGAVWGLVLYLGLIIVVSWKSAMRLYRLNKRVEQAC